MLLMRRKCLEDVLVGRGNGDVDVGIEEEVLLPEGDVSSLKVIVEMNDWVSHLENPSR